MLGSTSAGSAAVRNVYLSRQGVHDETVPSRAARCEWKHWLRPLDATTALVGGERVCLLGIVQCAWSSGGQPELRMSHHLHDTGPSAQQPDGLPPAPHQRSREELVPFMSAR
jgi:hypothetical protein